MDTMDLLGKNSSDLKLILGDLFVTIQYILSDFSCVTKTVAEDVIVFKIQNYPKQPTVLLMYDDCSKNKGDCEHPSDEFYSDSEDIDEMINDKRKEPLSSTVDESVPEVLTAELDASDYVEVIYDSTMDTDIEKRQLISPTIMNKVNANRSITNGHRSEGLINNRLHKETIQSKYYKAHLTNLQFKSEKNIPVRKKTTLISNRSEHYSEKPPYICQFCGKTFSVYLLKVQHELMHSEEKVHGCKYCRKLFKRLADKVRHERVHTGEKPYKCRYCEKSFSQSYSKTEHERIHTGERPYACEFCNKSFYSSGQKKKHEKTHTRYQTLHLHTM